MIDIKEIEKELKEWFVYYHIYDKNNISVIDLTDYSKFKEFYEQCQNKK